MRLLPDGLPATNIEPAVDLGRNSLRRGRLSPELRLMGERLSRHEWTGLPPQAFAMTSSGELPISDRERAVLNGRA
jgi:hypothetical protein